jgi:hypothetical protein
VRQFDVSTNGVRETSKVGEIGLSGVQQFDESTNGVRETSKLGGIGLIWLFPIGVFT